MTTQVFSRLALFCFATLVFGACGGDPKPDGSAALGVNASVPSSCQMCLSTSTGNECKAKGMDCTSDAECATLNKCINNCANINAACISSCGDSASANAIDEWNSWASCTCGTCATQCGATFCNDGQGSGSGSGSGSGQCIPDNDQCSQSAACCTFCADDGFCGPSS